MNILVTGATGFVGSHLLNKLKNKYRIHLLVRPNSSIEQINQYDYFVFDNNIQQLRDYLICNDIQGIIHLASLFVVQHKDTDIENLILSNIYLGTALLEASINTKVKWFLNTGTFWQNYSNNEQVFNPVNLYAATKQAFVDLAKFYEQTSDIIFVTLKICDTYGPNDSRPKIFALWDKISKSGESLLMSPGEQYIDILYIDDVVSGFEVLVQLLISGGDLESEYALYAQCRYKLKDLAKIFEEVTGKTLNIEWGKRPYREREVMTPWLVGNRLPNWKPLVDIRDGINKLNLNK